MVWRIVVITWRKVVKCWRKKNQWSRNTGHLRAQCTVWQLDTDVLDLSKHTVKYRVNIQEAFLPLSEKSLRCGFYNWHLVDQATPICFFGGAAARQPAAWTEVVCFVRSRCHASWEASAGYQSYKGASAGYQSYKNMLLSSPNKFNRAALSAWQPQRWLQVVWKEHKQCLWSSQSK